MLEDYTDNLEEYRNPSLYDLENTLEETELAFFARFAQMVKGPILDIACGTGRLTIPLAERGFSLTGVDLAPEMLTRAKQKTNSLGLDIRWVLADCTQMQLEQQFNFALMTGNAFQAFLDPKAQSAVLQSVHRHLRTNGLFAFEVRNPQPAHLLSRQNGVDETYTIDLANGQRFQVQEHCTYDPTTQIEHYIVTRTPLQQTETHSPATSQIRIRYTHLEQLNQLLCTQGFQIIEQYGDFTSAPYTKASPLIVTVCQKIT